LVVFYSPSPVGVNLCGLHLCDVSVSEACKNVRNRRRTVMSRGQGVGGLRACVTSKGPSVNLVTRNIDGF